jgi:hypothetical protein
MDDNAERLGRQKMRTDAMKRQFAVHGGLAFSILVLDPEQFF